MGTDRTRRMGDASTLQQAIDALAKVPKEHRSEYLHDRLMEAVDEICDKHTGQGRANFTRPQVAILKDVAFHIVFLLDPHNRRPKGVRGVLWRYSNWSVEAKIALWGVVVTLIVGAATLGYQFYKDGGRDEPIKAELPAASPLPDSVTVFPPPAPLILPN